MLHVVPRGLGQVRGERCGSSQNESRAVADVLEGSNDACGGQGRDGGRDDDARDDGRMNPGEVAERSNATDCKSVALVASEVRILPSPPALLPRGKPSRWLRRQKSRIVLG